eukprot:2541274-Prymnesium_polylepis.1
MAAPPCSTFSVSRFFHSGDSKTEGPLRCGLGLRSWASTTCRPPTSVNWRTRTRSFVACVSYFTLRAVRARSLLSRTPPIEAPASGPTSTSPTSMAPCG